MAISDGLAAHLTRVIAVIDGPDLLVQTRQRSQRCTNGGAIDSHKKQPLATDCR